LKTGEKADFFYLISGIWLINFMSEQKKFFQDDGDLREHFLNALNRKYFAVGRSHVKGWELWIFLGITAGLFLSFLSTTGLGAVGSIYAADNSRIKLSSPNGGEYLVAGESSEIKWSLNQDKNLLKSDYIEISLLSVKSGKNTLQNQIARVNVEEGAYSWLIPDYLAPGDYKVQVCTVLNSICFYSDASDRVFKIISKSSVKIISPNGSEMLSIGKEFSINFCDGKAAGATGFAEVYLVSKDAGEGEEIGLLHRDNFPTLLGDCENARKINWKVGTFIKRYRNFTEGEYKILVRFYKNSRDLGSSDVSDETFSIVNSEPQVRLFSPNGGDTWALLSGETFKWEAANLPDNVEFHLTIKKGKKNIGDFIAPSDQRLLSIYLDPEMELLRNGGGGGYKAEIRVHDKNTLKVIAKDESDSPFNIEFSSNEKISASLMPLESGNVVAGSGGALLAKILIDAKEFREDAKILSLRLKLETDGVDSMPANCSLSSADEQTVSGSNIVNPVADGTYNFVLDSPMVLFGNNYEISEILSLRCDIRAVSRIGGRISWKLDSTNPITALGASSLKIIKLEKANSIENSSKVTIVERGKFQIEDLLGQNETWHPDGAEGLSLGTFKMRAQDEDAVLENFQVELKSGSAGDITAIYLYDGSTLLQKKAFPSFTSRLENFSFNSSGPVADGSLNSPTKYLKLKAGSSKIITLKIDFAVIAGTNGTSGQLVKIIAGPVAAQSAVGQNSGIQLFADITRTTSSAGARYFRGVPKIENVEIPTGTFLSTNAVLNAFKITAVGGDIGIYKFTFNTSSSISEGGSVGQYVLRDDTLMTDLNRPIEAREELAEIFVNNAEVFTLASPWVRILEGTSHIFVLKAKSVNLTSTSGEKIQTELLGDGDVPPCGLPCNATDIKAAFNNFIWTDFTAEATSFATRTSTSDWINGYRVPGLENLKPATVSEN